MQSEYVCAGSSRALRTASEKVIRVVATPMPELIISWVDVKATDRLYINFQYVLFDEAGEMHPPKDDGRREIKLDATLETSLRQQVLSDLDKMYKKGLPLAPGFLRQLGREEEALATEAMLCHRPQMEEGPQMEESGGADIAAFRIQSVGDRTNCGPEAVSGEGEMVVPRAVGRVPSDVGSMADQRKSRRSSRNMGAGGDSVEYGGDGELEGGSGRAVRRRALSTPRSGVGAHVEAPHPHLRRAEAG